MVFVFTSIHKYRSCDDAPDASSSMDGHSIYRIIDAHSEDEFGEKEIEESCNTGDHGSSPGLESVTSGTD